MVQIIGRCTRDCEGKTHAQFTNLIPCPDAEQDDVKVAVNNMMKAITASLLMEQVMAPKWNFKTKKDEDFDRTEGEKTLRVDGLAELSPKAKAIVENDMTDITADLLSNDLVQQAITQSNEIAEMFTQVLIPKIIREKYPELDEDEIEAIRERVVLTTATQGAEIVEQSDGRKFLKIANRFIEIDKVSINLIDSINPFQRAYEILSKSITPDVLKTIETVFEEQRSDMTKEEAVILFQQYLPKYKLEHGGRLPTLEDPDPIGRRIAQAIAFIANLKRRKLAQQQ